MREGKGQSEDRREEGGGGGGGTWAQNKHANRTGRSSVGGQGGGGGREGGAEKETVRTRLQGPTQQAPSSTALKTFNLFRP